MPGPISQTRAPAFIDHFGLIGSAFFDAGSAAITNLVKTGVVTSVTYSGKGQYTFVISSQADTKYLIIATCGDNSDKLGYFVSVLEGSKSATGFVLQSQQDFRSPANVNGISILICRPT
jgi:hypothetical protein